MHPVMKEKMSGVGTLSTKVEITIHAERPTLYHISLSFVATKKLPIHMVTNICFGVLAQCAVK